VRLAVEVVLQNRFQALVGADVEGQGALRGGFHGHALHVDGPRGTISLDQGVPISFTGSETDLEVENEHGQTVYVNTSQLAEGFIGDVPVGTFGRIREILFSKFLVQ